MSFLSCDMLPRFPWNEHSKQTYMLLNRVLVLAMVVLGAAIVTCHCWIGTTSCWLKTVFDRECIFCGCTRDFFDIVSTGGPVRNKLSVWMMGWVVAEFTWRLLGSFVRVGRLVVVYDILFHVVTTSIFLVFNFMIIFGFY